MTTYENKEKKAYIRPSLEAVWIDADALLDGPIITGSTHGQAPGEEGDPVGAKAVVRTARLSTREQAALAAEFELEDELEEETISGIFGTNW